MANALIGLHEQTRLQEAIEGALVAPFSRLREKRSALFSRAPARLQALGDRIREKGLEPADQLQVRWLAVCTRFMMTLALPDRILNLGIDVPPLENGESFPPLLRVVGSARARDLYARFSRVRRALEGSAATSWADLDDRMNYIVNLFRSRHEAESLHRPPFGAEQQEDIRAGRMPSGPVQPRMSRREDVLGVDPSQK